LLAIENSKLKLQFEIYVYLSITKMPTNNYHTLVLGMGNDLLTDDAIGPKLTWRLEKSVKLEGVKFDTAFVGGLDILDLIKDYKKVIFIDAIKTKGGIPGTVYIFNTNDFKETLHLSNLHDVSFLTAIELGKNLGLNIPPEISIIAIEIKEDLVFSEHFTAEIEARYEEIYKKTKKYLLSMS
jgi:hydrogenase maturation protease